MASFGEFRQAEAGVRERSEQRFSISRIAKLAHQAGFRGRDLAIATAVALAESKGKPGAIGDEHLTDDKWGPSIGLWQVRSLWEERGTGGTRDGTVLRQPTNNARSAFEIAQTPQGFNHWTMYRNGRYSDYLPQVTEVIQQLGGSIAEGVPSNLKRPQEITLTQPDPVANEQEVREVFNTFVGRRPKNSELNHWTGVAMDDLEDVAQLTEAKTFTAAQAYNAFARQVRQPSRFVHQPRGA